MELRGIVRRNFAVIMRFNYVKVLWRLGIVENVIICCSTGERLGVDENIMICCSSLDWLGTLVIMSINRHYHSWEKSKQSTLGAMH